MDWKKELKVLAAFVGIFVAAYALPLENPKIAAAIQEAFRLLQWYARNHTLACVVPAMFIAGAVVTFLSQASVMRYLGARAVSWRFARAASFRCSRESTNWARALVRRRRFFIPVLLSTFSRSF